MKGHVMKLLKFDLTLEGASLPDFIASAAVFREGIKLIAPSAQVSLTFSSSGQVLGDVQIQRLPISRLQQTVDAISGFISSQFPGVTIIYIYLDSEDD